MKCFAACLCLLSLAVPFMPATLEAAEPWSDHPEWSGGWKSTPDVAKLMGFEIDKDRAASMETLQFNFLIHRDAALAVLGKELVENAEGRAVKMGHQMIAAGNYKVQPAAGDADSMFFVTRKEGGTFLWLGNQKDFVSAVKLHYIRGADFDQDLLILEPSGIFKRRLKGKFHAPPVGYRRIPQPLGE